MGDLKEKIKEISLKREEAINSVKYNLKRYALLKLYPEKVEDRVSSFSSSLIMVSADENVKTEYNKMIRALAREEEDTKFIDKYDYLLSCLCEETNHYIIRIYFNKERIETIKDERTNIYYYMKDMYEIIACLDESIDYNIEDYCIYKNYMMDLKQKDTWKVKQLALDYLNKSKNGLLVDEIHKTLELLPPKEKKYVEKYIYEEDPNYTSYEYRIVLRGLLLFAYYFKPINFDKDELEVALKKTGSGWKKILKDLK